MSTCQCGCGGSKGCKRSRPGPTGPTGYGGPTGAGGPTGGSGSTASGYLKWSGTLVATLPGGFLADTGEANVTVGGFDYPIGATPGRPFYPFGRNATIESFYVNIPTVLNGGQTVVVTLVLRTPEGVDVDLFAAQYNGANAPGGIILAAAVGAPPITIAQGDTIDVQVGKTGTFTGTLNVSAIATFK